MGAQFLTVWVPYIGLLIDYYHAFWAGSYWEEPLCLYVCKTNLASTFVGRPFHLRQGIQENITKHKKTQHKLQLCFVVNHSQNKFLCLTHSELCILASMSTLSHWSLLSLPSPSLVTALRNCLLISVALFSSFAFLLFIKNQLILTSLLWRLAVLFIYNSL